MNVDRSTALPIKYINVFQEIGIAVANYGDVAFLSQMEQTTEIVSAFKKLNELGFDGNILGRIV